MLLSLYLALVLQSWVGKLPEDPHPVASSISSRMMVELGMVTAIMATAAAVIGGFLASAVFAVTSFIFATTVYVVWPMARPFLKLFHGLIFGIFESVGENLLDIFGDVSAKFYEFYTFGSISASFLLLIPIVLILFTMVLLIRFTLSRRPKNFRKWVTLLCFCSFLSCICYIPRTNDLSDYMFSNCLTRFIHDIYFTSCRIYGKGLIFHGLKLKLVLTLVSLDDPVALYFLCLYNLKCKSFTILQ